MSSVNAAKYAQLDELAEEIAGRLRCGERPTLAEYLQRYPELADDIRAWFPALIEVEQMKPPAQPTLRQIGDFRLLRELGRGGMGIVYEAEQLALGRRVALKVLPTHAERDSAAAERFQRETRAVAKLQHPHIVPLYEVGQTADVRYYAMQLIIGQPLDRVIHDLQALQHRTSIAPPELTAPTRTLIGDHTGPAPTTPARPTPALLPPPTPPPTGRNRAFYQRVARIGVQTASALAHAHAHGIVHRDIKPSNLLLDVAGAVWITDFGLAVDSDPATGASLTKTGELVGTLRYMAPERFSGRCDVRSDIFSVGLTLYELLALRPAYQASNHVELMCLLIDTDPVPLRTLDPHLPRDLATIVTKASAREPERRYASAQALADDLQAFLDDRPIRARPVGAPEYLVRLARRYPAIAFLCAVILLITSVGLLATAQQYRQAVANAQLAQERQAETQVVNERLALELYIANMNRANTHWEAGAAQACRDLLALHEPSAGAPDLRGLEWHYLHHLAHASRPTFAIGNRCEAMVPHPTQPLVAVAGPDGAALFNYRTGQRMQVLVGHQGGVQALAFSADGQRLYTAGVDHTVRVWETSSGQQLHLLSGHTAQVMSVALSADGQTVLTGSEDGTIRLWNAHTGQALRRLTDLGDTVALARWWQKDTRVLLARWTNPALVDWNVSAPDLPTRTQPLPRNVSRFHLRPDERQWAFTDWSGWLHIWDAQTQRPLVPARSLNAAGLAYSPDGQTLAVGTMSGQILLFASDTLELRHTLRGQGQAIRQLAFVDCGRRLLAGDSTAVQMWDWAVPQDAVRTVAHAGPLEALAFSPDGRWLASVSGSTAEVRLWDAHSRQLRLELTGHRLGCRHIAFNSAGTQLASAGHDGTVRLWDVADGRCVRAWAAHKELWLSVTGVVFSPDGTRLATAGWDHTLALWDVASGDLLRRWRGHGHNWSVQFSPDGTRLLGMSGVDYINTLAVWEVATGTELPALTTTANHFTYPPVAHPQQPWLALPAGNEIMLLAWADGQEHRPRWRGHAVTPTGLAFNQDGSRLVSVGHDRLVKVWHTASRQELLTLTGAADLIRCVAVCPQNRQIVCGCNDGSLHWWHTAAKWVAHAE
jgi:WD40 repeat protein/serine/threonine protein kinase